MRTAPRQILRLNVKSVNAALPGSSTPPAIDAADAPNSQQAHGASKPGTAGLAAMPHAAEGPDVHAGTNYAPVQIPAVPSATATQDVADKVAGGFGK